MFQLTYSMAKAAQFLYSTAFVTLLMLLGFVVDFSTTSLGIAKIIFSNTELLQRFGGLSPQVAAWLSYLMSGILALIISGVCAISSRQSGIGSFMLSFLLAKLSFIISYYTLAGSFDVTPILSGDLNSIITFSFYVAGALIPIIAYTFNSRVVNKELGTHIHQLNESVNMAVRKSLDEEAKDAIELMKARGISVTRKASVSPMQVLKNATKRIAGMDEKPKQEPKSTATYQDLLNQLNAN